VAGVGIFVLQFGVMPTDALAIRVVAALWSLLCVVGGLASLLGTLAVNFPSPIRTMFGVFVPICWMSAIVFASAAAPERRSRTDQTAHCRGLFAGVPARRALLRTWATLRCASVAIGLVNIIANIVLGVIYSEDFLVLWLTAAACILMSAIATPRNRARIQRAFGRLASRGEAQQAAAVAALVGRLGPAKALALAKRNFCGIAFNVLAEEDFLSSGDTGLHERTAKAALGKVDVFLSHSWHDDAAIKWRTLQAWAATFQGEQRRAPSIWLDKACIDQTKIDENLACLPVYLAGCQELLVLAGPTYVRRLWCVVELYTFLKMGGSLERVQVVGLVGAEAGGQGDARAALRESFATFAARNAECFKSEDRERLLGVIEAGFGLLDDFDLLVRHLLSTRRRRSFSLGDEARSYDAAPHAVQTAPGVELSRA